MLILIILAIRITPHGPTFSTNLGVQERITDTTESPRLDTSCSFPESFLEEIHSKNASMIIYAHVNVQIHRGREGEMCYNVYVHPCTSIYIYLFIYFNSKFKLIFVCMFIFVSIFLLILIFIYIYIYVCVCV